MKLLFTIATFDVGGSEVMALNLAVKLKERGHEVLVFCANEAKWDAQLVAKYRRLGLQLYSLKDWPRVQKLVSKIMRLLPHAGLRNAIAYKIKARFVQRLAAAQKVDLVCSHAPSADAIVKMAFQNTAMPLVMVEHGRYSHYLWQGNAYKVNALHAASAVVTVSDFCTAQIRTYLGLSKNVQTVYNGLADEAQPGSRAAARQALNIPEQGIVFGLAARGVPKKGWKNAIDAFLAAGAETNKNIHLLLVGGSRFIDGLKEKYGAHKNIHFTGKVPNPAFYMQGMDVGLMLSHYRTEAFSLSAVEFLLAGKPVIATHVGGVPEVLQFEQTTFGCLLQLEEDGTLDNNRLKEAMLEFINGHRALQLNPAELGPALQRFSMDACAEGYERVFSDSMQQNNFLQPRTDTQKQARLQPRHKFVS